MATKYFSIGWSGDIARTAFGKLGVSDFFASLTGCGDFNGDGHQDLLFAITESETGVHSGPIAARLILMAGDGKGGFSDKSSLLPEGGKFDYAQGNVAVADLNGDGVDDLAMTPNMENGREMGDASADSVAQFAYMSHHGRLVRVDYGYSTWGAALATGDINGDGRADLIAGGFQIPKGATGSTAMLFQQADGSLSSPTWVAGLSGLSVAIGDFDGDGEVELADYYTAYDQPLWPSGLRVTEIADDGSIESSSVNLISPLRIEDGRGWNGPAQFQVRVDANGNEYVDQGLHQLKVGDLNGDGKDDIVAVRFGFSMNYVDGVLTEGGESRGALELYGMRPDGFAPLEGAWIKGWKFPTYGVSGLTLTDFDGDGHLDLFVKWSESADSARIFLNDGDAHFTRLKQSLLPAAPAQFGVSLEPIDANEDGIMDLVRKADGFDKSWSAWDAKSEIVFLGTEKFYTGPSFTDPAVKGAAGFNEHYYLNNYADAAAAVKAHKYKTGLDHYLDKGKGKGYFGFAVDTHIFGSEKNDTIKAREGEERLDGGLGKDMLIGKGSSDTFVFSSKLGPTNVDTIKDFKVAQGDLIALDHDIFRRVGPALGGGEFYAAKGAIKAHDGSDRIIYNKTTGDLYYDADGKGGTGAVHFATLLNHPTSLDHGDFLIV